jgi:hypothetical protein
MTIEQHWNQTDGGIRLLVTTDQGDLTIDQAPDRSLSGFTRPGFRGDEDRALRAAFRFVRKCGYGPHCLASAESTEASIDVLDQARRAIASRADRLARNPQHRQTVIDLRAQYDRFLGRLLAMGWQ